MEKLIIYLKLSSFVLIVKVEAICKHRVKRQNLCMRAQGIQGSALFYIQDQCTHSRHSGINMAGRRNQNI